MWKNGVIKYAFWAINIGLALMVFISALPVGLAQTVASVTHGFWYARSAEFLQSGTLDTFRWLRVIGDTVFATGVVALAYFVIGLKTGWSIKKEVHNLFCRDASPKRLYNINYYFIFITTKLTSSSGSLSFVHFIPSSFKCLIISSGLLFPVSSKEFLALL